jgi:hypothetical protein
MNKLITLSTGDPITNLCEREVDRELARLERQVGAQVIYAPANRAKLTGGEIRSAEDAVRFVDLTKRVFRQCAEAGDEIYVNLTGGRKSMVVAVAIAAQFCDVRMMFHLWVHEDIEEKGDILKLQRMTEDERELYLRPPEDQIALVQMEVQRVDRSVADRRDRLRDRLFEEAVGDYVTMTWGEATVFRRFQPDYLKRPDDLGDVDVYVEKKTATGREVFALECKLGKNLTTEMVRKVAARCHKIQQEWTDAHGELVLHGGIVFYQAEWEEGAAELARKLRLERWRATLPANWENQADWEVTALTKEADVGPPEVDSNSREAAE